MTIPKSYGSWSSPILPSVCMASDIDYIYLCQDQCVDIKSMMVYFIEFRSGENGRNVIVSKDMGIKLSENITWTPNSFSARSRINEYGGASMFVHYGRVYFSNEYDQHLYMQEKPMSTPIRVSQKANCRYANGFFSSPKKAIFIVREDHSDGNNVVNTIVAIRDDQEIVVVSGTDFYSSPRVSADSSRLCWIEWRFPNMPWDNTRVCTAILDKDSINVVPESLEIFAQSSDSNPLSCTLPIWTKNNDLLYINDKTGFWNIWIARNAKNQTNLTPVNEDIGDPMSRLDFRKYNYSSIRDQIVLARKGGKLELKNIDGSSSKIIELQSILSYICYPELMPDGSIVAIGYSSKTKKTIYHITEDGECNIIGCSPLVDGINPKYFSIPKHLKYPVENTFSYGFFYPPCNPDYCGLEGTLPPLLVLAHGGPISATSTHLNMKVQYWTSRGFGVLDVDYRGSTGYGRVYRQLLRGNWGVYDMEDCCGGADYLVKQNLVDGNKLLIAGGSGGGYTTLCCLTFRSTFKGGCSLYGIGDLEALIKDTHKFESHYLDLLIGKYEECKNVYYERSPINFPEQIKYPIIFFQGADDKVVPQEQSIKMFEVVKSAGIPCAMVIYPGEQHGFRKTKNIIHQMESEYYFYSQILAFEPTGIGESSIIIENFKKLKD